MSITLAEESQPSIITRPGQHRYEEVGSLRWSDDGCLIAERMRWMIEAAVSIRKTGKCGLADKPDYITSLEIQYCELTELPGEAGAGCGQ